MKIALVRGARGKGAYTSSFGVSMPPLGLASLAGAVMLHGHEVTLVDATSKGLTAEETARIIEDEGAQLVAVTMIASPYYEFGVELAKRVKAEREDAVCVAGGQHATFLYPQVLRDGFDYAVLGEGEETFCELVGALERGGDASEVKGLAFIKDGKPFMTGARPPMQSLDLLPMPAFQLFEKDQYRADLFGEGSRIITLETSRGCPYNCEFCSETAMWGHRWKFKSVERILKEMRQAKSLGYNWVFIVDDNFIVPANTHDRERLFDEMVDDELNTLNLIVQLRADLAASRPNIIKNAAEAGVRIAFLGLESGSDPVLKAMGKGTSTAAAEEGIKVLHQNGILIFGGFIIGAPYESKDDVKKTFKYADRLRRVGLDSAQFSIYTPLPGTNAFLEALHSDSLLTFDWELYDCLHPVLKTRINPLWLYLNSGLNGNLFYFKKWISEKISGEKSDNPVLSSGYSELVQSATKFLVKNLSKYVRGFVMLPIDTLRFWSILRKAKPNSDILKEILNNITYMNLNTYQKCNVSNVEI